MEQNFEYFAFISYKREDEKWAKWLQDKLRWYKTPSKLCKQITRLPKRVWPVFRDNTDLDGGVLEQNIRRELERSHYLIVICSPEAARSPWVGKEVEYFASIGKADKIIPFVVSGKPYSNNTENECIHEQIKAASETELLVININEEGLSSNSMKKRRAFIRVVSRLLDIKFNALWQPYERTLKIKRWGIGVASVILLLGFGYVWDYNRTKYKFYADYVDKWGIPEGVHKLTNTEINHKNKFYQFEYSKNKLQSLKYTNSAGTPQMYEFNNYFDRTPIQLFYYNNKNGELFKVKCLETNGKELFTKFYSGEKYEYLDFKYHDGNGALLPASFASIASNIIQKENINYNSAIGRYVLTRNKNGYITRMEFKKNSFNSPTFDASGISGMSFKLDSVNRISAIEYIDTKGNTVENRLWVIKKTFTYSQGGNISQIINEDRKGYLTENEAFWAVCRIIDDHHGNIFFNNVF